MVLGDGDGLRVLEDVRPGLDRDRGVGAVLVGGRRDRAAVADGFAVGVDAPGLGLFEDGIDCEVDPVRLDLVVGNRLDVVSDERPRSYMPAVRWGRLESVSIPLFACSFQFITI